jgi:hypothetical protein
MKLLLYELYSLYSLRLCLVCFFTRAYFEIRLRAVHLARK